MKKLILIDGNAILHRAYHALPPLTNKNGIVVNAVYGFFSMFLKILDDQKPDFIIVCFDRKAPTFRKELFVGYQAKRPTMSSDLVPQIKFVHEILENSKVEIFEVDGYEADDMIGTLAAQAARINTNTTNKQISNKGSKKNIGEFEIGNLKLEIFIVSGDRDLLQLVNHHVKMIAPVTGLTNMLVYDSNKVQEKFGIKPAQMVDYKALVGDSSDNYPGVSGVGPKTAANLINEYKSLDGIYKNLDKLKKKNPNLALKLANGAEAAGLAQKLAGIVLDAPIKLDIKKADIKNLDQEGLKKQFEKFGFKSLLNRLNGKKNMTIIKKKEEPKTEKPANKQMELL